MTALDRFFPTLAPLNTATLLQHSKGHLLSGLEKTIVEDSAIKKASARIYLNFRKKFS